MIKITKKTYSAVTHAWVIPATPTDMVVLSGGASGVIKVLGVFVTGTQTTAGINKFFLLKRSTLDSGGTFVSGTIVKHDTKDPPSRATFGHYTANPTLGTLIGNIAVKHASNPAPASVVDIDVLTALFDFFDSEPIVLRGTEQLALNFNGVALPVGLTLAVTMVWQEEF